jgi:diguanylate cyclase (GGDEF)-like protein
VARGIFTQDDIGVLVAIISYVAGALETARAAQLEKAMAAADRQRELAETLRLAMVELSGTLDRNEVLGRLVVTMTRVVGAETAWLVCHDPSGGAALVLTAAGDGRPGRWDEHRVEIDGGLRRLLAVREPLLASAGDHLLVTPAPHPPPASGIVVPLATRGARIGVVLIVSQDPEAFGQTELDIVTALAVQAMVAYENARLFSRVEELATTDELTGLANRRHFFDLGERELVRARRNGDPLAAMMIDIDRFKDVNDRHGHQVGDQVIAAVAERLAALVRGNDVLGRYGGEEFALVLNAPAGEDVTLAERLRRSLAERPVATGSGPIEVTISIGVTRLGSGDADLGALLARADRGLYAAKQAGRNRVLEVGLGA